jgi:hypothetical protein
LAIGCLCASASAGEIQDPLTGAKLDAVWEEHLSPRSKGSVQITPQGVVLKAEPRQYVLLQRRNLAGGSDARPLFVSVRVQADRGAALSAALHLYWDPANYVSFGCAGERHLTLSWAAQGERREQTFPIAASEHARGLYVRLVVTSRNVFLFTSGDGASWKPLAPLGARPGDPESAPGLVLLGRGWAGPLLGKPAVAPGLANSLSEDEARHVVACCFRDFALFDAPVPLPRDPPGLARRETWSETLEAFSAGGVPSAWLLLGPVPDRKNQRFRKELPPDTTDDWRAIPKDDAGAPFQATPWTRPDAAAGSYVNLAEVLAAPNDSLAYARAEVESPVAGPALLRFDADGRAAVYWNGAQVFLDEDSDRRAQEDAHVLPVALRRGTNILKVKTHQQRGAWGFYARVERNDPEFRVRLLERLLEWFPDEAAGGARLAEARLEIARRHVQRGDYPAALAAYQKVLELHADSDEHRLQALGGQLALLEDLRDWPGLAEAGERRLRQSGPSAPGADWALRALLLGLARSGRLDVAEARAAEEAARAGADGRRVWDAWSLLAAAAPAAGGRPHQWAAWERLAESPAVTESERARAACAAAFGRLEDYAEAQRARQVPADAALLAETCRVARLALDLLPGKDHPQARRFAEEAAADLAAGRAERAATGYWASVLLALAASDAETAALWTVPEAVALPEWPGATAGLSSGAPAFKDLRAAKDWLAARLPRESALPRGLGPWQGIGPFENRGGVGEDASYGPERNADLGAKHEGRGGLKAWVPVDPKRAWGEGVPDVQEFVRDSRGGVVYLAREFEVAEPLRCACHWAASAAWTAWLDGQPLGCGSGSPAGETRALELSAGKHRLLFKLPVPPDEPLSFRAGWGTGAHEEALLLLALAWLVREQPLSAGYAKGADALRWLASSLRGKAEAAGGATLLRALAWLYPHAEEREWEGERGAVERLQEAGRAEEAYHGWRWLWRRMEAAGFGAGGNPGTAWTSRLSPDSPVERAGRLLLARGEAGAADELFRDALARHPVPGEPAARLLLQRAALRCALGPGGTAGLSSSGAAGEWAERVIRECGPSAETARGGTAGLSSSGAAVRVLRFARGWQPERVQVETAHEVQAAVDAARRQMATGQAEDVERAVRNLLEALRGSPEAVVRAGASAFLPRYVGLREFARGWLSQLDEPTRAQYRAAVARPSREQFHAAAGDPAALETLAAEYPFTPVACEALNSAGNLYLDRGDFPRAAAVFRALLRERGEGKIGTDTILDGQNGVCPYFPPLLLAKLAHALMLNGQAGAARAAADQLEREYGSQRLVLAGRTVTGAEVAERTRQRLAQMERPLAAQAVEGAATHGGGPARRGALRPAPAPTPAGLAWSAPLLSTASLETSLPAGWTGPAPGLTLFPCASGERVFVSTLESLCALDLRTGRPVWTQSWSSTGKLRAQPFAGIPRSCPTFQDGRVYLRVLSGERSALRCYQAADGRLCWSSEEVPAFRRALWLSDPGVAFGIAAAVFLEPGETDVHGVAAFDAASGRLLWRRELAAGPNGAAQPGQEFLGGALQLGPPAADGGFFYTSTGLGTVAALNAFTGDCVWLAGYPRARLGGLEAGLGPAAGQASAWRLAARGPLAPVVLDDVVAVAPADSPALLAFDRQTGVLRWQRELFPEPFLCGAWQDRLLAAGPAIRAYRAANGTVAWEYALGDETLCGQPGLADGIVYAPTSRRLHLVDARTGQRRAVCPWPAGVGPLANLIVGEQRVVGVRAGACAALAPAGEAPAPSILDEAAALAAAGQVDVATERYAEAVRSEADFLPALTGRLEMLARLGRGAEALEELDRALEGRPEILEDVPRGWRIAQRALAEAYRRRLDPAPPAPASERPPAGVLSGAGTLAYAWSLEGENPRLCLPADGAPDRFLVCLDDRVALVRARASPETLWQTRVGPDVRELAAGPSAVAACTGGTLSVLARDTGAPLWRVLLSSFRAEHGLRPEQVPGFDALAVGRHVVAAAAGEVLAAFEAGTGRVLWWNVRRSRERGRLVFLEDRLVEVSGTPGERAEDYQTLYSAYDSRTGACLKSVVLSRRAAWARFVVSPDDSLLLYRPEARALAALSLEDGSERWRVQAPNLRFAAEGPNLRLEGQRLLYSGEVREPGTQGWATLALDVSRGKLLCGFTGRVSCLGRSFVLLQDEWGRTLSRLEPDAEKLREVWGQSLPEEAVRGHFLQKAFLSGDQDVLYLLYVRSGPSLQYVLRVLDWHSGQLLGEEVLPGTPRHGREGGFHELYGPLLLYGAREGLFAYASTAGTRSERIAHLRLEVREAGRAEGPQREARRALASLERPSAQAFLAPPQAGRNLGTDPTSGLSADSVEPVLLGSAEEYQPLAEGAGWGGPADLSAEFRLGWNAQGFFVVANVRDDVVVEPVPGALAATGDCLQVGLNSVSTAGFLAAGENVVCTLARVEGRSVLHVSGEPGGEGAPRPAGQVTPAPDRKGLRYELFLPWAFLRQDARLAAGGTRKELRLGVAVRDDDGHGVKGALEWGAGLTGASLRPEWLGEVALLDVSRARIERLRLVLDQLPDSPEALKYLELILSSKRGPNAERERAEELEAFLKKHPRSVQATRALALLRAAYHRLGEDGATAKAAGLAEAAGCAPEAVSNLAGKVLRIWVRPDPRQPPQAISIRFRALNRAALAVAEFGDRQGVWSVPNSPAARSVPCGPVPPPGQWSALEVSAVDLNLEQAEIESLSFTVQAGLAHFARLSCVTDGREEVLLEGSLPNSLKLEGQPIRFVEDMLHEGQRAWLAGGPRGLFAWQLLPVNRKLLFSFKDARPAPAVSSADARAMQGAYRRAAGLLADTPDGWAFLRRVLDGYLGEDRAARCVAECEEFLKRHPETPDAPAILQNLREWYGQLRDPNPGARCEKLIREARLPRSAARAFQAQSAAGWVVWHVLGPFPAGGEHLGLDVMVGPERGVDLAWKTKGPYNLDLGWRPYSAPRDERGRLLGEGFVELHRLLLAPLDKRLAEELQREPYFAYAYRRFAVPERRRAVLFFSCNDRLSIWLNGRRVVTESTPGEGKDRACAEVVLNAGENEVLIKTATPGGKLTFFFRVADENGRPFEDL